MLQYVKLFHKVTLIKPRGGGGGRGGEEGGGGEEGEEGGGGEEGEEGGGGEEGGEGRRRMIINTNSGILVGGK